MSATRSPVVEGDDVDMANEYEISVSLESDHSDSDSGLSAAFPGQRSSAFPLSSYFRHWRCPSARTCLRFSQRRLRMCDFRKPVVVGLVSLVTAIAAIVLAVSASSSSSSSSSMSTPASPSATDFVPTRSVYWAAREATWNYVPAGYNVITGNPFSAKEQVFTDPGPHR